MLKLIVEKNMQMKEMEEQIEKLLKEREETAYLIQIQWQPYPSQLQIQHEIHHQHLMI